MLGTYFGGFTIIRIIVYLGLGWGSFMFENPPNLSASVKVEKTES